MELSALSEQAVKIALWSLEKASGGALSKVGSEILNLLVKQFQGKLDIGESQPKVLEAEVVSEAEWNQEFRKELEKLVNQYQQIQNNSSVSQNTESGVNINAENNSGTVIGQQIDNRLFR
ncbi:MAG: hypothetical protein AAF821_24910 [Cyanobacteria bacterium P01_D01_bin.156]